MTTTQNGFSPRKLSEQELSGMDIAEIADRVRADLKAAVRGGALPAFKTSVRISRYAGGQSLSVTVTKVPAGYQVLNHLNLAYAKANPHTHPAYAADESVRNRNCDTAIAHLQVITEIVDAYNWDRSDIQADYFRCNFYATVRFAHEVESAEREAFEATPVAPATVAAPVVSSELETIRAEILAAQTQAHSTVERLRAELVTAVELARVADALAAEAAGTAPVNAGPRLRLVKS